MRRILCLSLLSLAAATAAQASVVDVVGDKVSVERVVVDGGIYQSTPLSSQIIAAGGSVFNHDATFAFSGDTLTIGFASAYPYLKTLFDGYKLTDETKSFAGTFKGASTTLANFCECRVTTAGKNLFVNLGGLTPLTTDTVVLKLVPLPAVPEPETYAMMLAGLGLVAGIARRRSKAVIA
ncbi:PEPxxWA-CTERM sorting domain-containing protein [Xylophilus sp. GOD-11R]|uniref:PEPxxWA-CTERM sorting domain-containing protein n=1 Tax=Xylophilus sp. GOD-11R TaxID=3089814 RepID=UPI00298C7D54|nr:PEPxxWA-CTERM sorting domain-containing protein [Xylophilus sp. GOD-11R]WPB57687.1 PEPxxWA-CTERM sorting domain-containing protein [Xylophilus sp. GOD-11R]